MLLVLLPNALCAQLLQECKTANSVLTAPLALPARTTIILLTLLRNALCVQALAYCQTATPVLITKLVLYVSAQIMLLILMQDACSAQHLQQCPTVKPVPTATHARYASILTSLGNLQSVTYARMDLIGSMINVNLKAVSACFQTLQNVWLATLIKTSCLTYPLAHASAKKATNF
jgi:hypothetical protein